MGGTQDLGLPPEGRRGTPQNGAGIRYTGYSHSKHAIAKPGSQPTFPFFSLFTIINIYIKAVYPVYQEAWRPSPTWLPAGYSFAPACIPTCIPYSAFHSELLSASHLEKLRTAAYLVIFPPSLIIRFRAPILVS